jgi:hypothetical protein
VERIYARQKGVFGLQEQIAVDDVPSRALFHRNQSPFCAAPKTENEPACNALKAKPARLSGLYPTEIQSDPKFCEMLSKAPNAAELTGLFTVVVNDDQPGTYRTVPYTEVYREDMELIANELEAAAAGLGADETALSVYQSSIHRVAAQAGADETRDGKHVGSFSRQAISGTRSEFQASRLCRRGLERGRPAHALGCHCRPSVAQRRPSGRVRRAYGGNDQSLC